MVRREVQLGACSLEEDCFQDSRMLLPLPSQKQRRRLPREASPNRTIKGRSTSPCANSMKLSHWPVPGEVVAREEATISKNGDPGSQVPSFSMHSSPRKWANIFCIKIVCLQFDFRSDVKKLNIKEQIRKSDRGLDEFRLHCDLHPGTWPKMAG